MGEWILVGQMMSVRLSHAVSISSTEEIKMYCYNWSLFSKQFSIRIRPCLDGKEKCRIYHINKVNQLFPSNKLVVVLGTKVIYCLYIILKKEYPIIPR